MLLMALLAVMSLFLTGCSSGKNSLKLSTGGTGGVYYRYGGELSELLSRKEGAPSLDVQSSAGSA